MQPMSIILSKLFVSRPTVAIQIDTFVGMKVIVTSVDLFRDSVLVHFANGETAIFSHQFLFTNRNRDGNTVMREDGELTEDVPKNHNKLERPSTRRVRR